MSKYGSYNKQNYITEKYNKNHETISGNYDNTLNWLDQNYGNSQDALDKSKHQSQQRASIVYDKLKKYLPTQIKAQGLGGLGVSESSMLQAYNNYNSDMGAIEGDYQDRSANLLQNYTQTRSETENAKTSELSELEQAYLTDMFNADKDEKREQYNVESVNVDSMYQNMIGTDGKISEADYKELESYIKEKRESLGDDYTALLTAQLNGYTVRDAASQGKLDMKIDEITIKGNFNTANDDYGDNFEITYNDKPYKVEKGHDADDETNHKIYTAYKDSTGSIPALGSTIVYEGKIYMYLENNDKGYERWCVVQPREKWGTEDLGKLCKELGITSYSRG